MTHLLHLMVKDALGEGSQNPLHVTGYCTYWPLLMKFQFIVGDFSLSHKDTYQLHEKQTLLGLPEHSLFCDVSTHWISTCAMLEHLVTQKGALTALISETGVIREENRLIHDEWVIVSQVVEPHLTRERRIRVDKQQHLSLSISEAFLHWLDSMGKHQATMECTPTPRVSWCSVVPLGRVAFAGVWQGQLAPGTD
ncbi:UNVERIFIED_CONTAM: hypothetical protein K2H54_042992 [Gekko kuhli]